MNLTQGRIEHGTADQTDSLEEGFVKALDKMSNLYIAVARLAEASEEVPGAPDFETSLSNLRISYDVAVRKLHEIRDGPKYK